MFGTMLFIDLGDKHTAVVSRYEGDGGQLKVEFNQYLQARVHGPSVRQVQLENILIGGAPAFSPDEGAAVTA